MEGGKPRLPALYPLLYEPLVRSALAEDLGRAGDLTSDAILPEDLLAEGRIVARTAGRVAGLAVATSAFRL
ncbi:MAG TPA: nicotinate-nucleotide diphosphorylase (carboxylating), partial [Thermoanaerobaculia bacterium]|nr:nicotinate-nucleotide diphosphorylase (carboxylating) [Thermoanaerobaculia bacterium]